MKTSFRNIAVVIALLLLSVPLTAQKRQRPFIWVKQSDRQRILDKIETRPWAKKYYEDFTARIDKDLTDYRDSPEDFLKKIPLDWDNLEEGVIPNFKIITDFGNSKGRAVILEYVQIGIDCGVLYFLTQDERYAQMATDILYTFVMGLSRLEPSEDTSNAGWVYPGDHLREAREIGAQLPIIYDFIASYLATNARAYDIVKEKQVPFPENTAQKIFFTYAHLAINRGHTKSNWSVLEANSLIQNSLAIDSPKKRDSLLRFYLEKGTDRQDALPVVADAYGYEGSVFPESSQYSNSVASRTTKMMVLLDNYAPELDLAREYDNIPLSLDRWNSFRYPNGEIIRFGDGKRQFHEPYEAYEAAYLLGRLDTVPRLRKKFGSLIRTAMENGNYQRGTLGKRTYGASEYWEPTALLWFEDEVEGDVLSPELPRTDALSHASVFLQRNLSDTGDTSAALMGFVGGAHYVHAHASGMDMELYGQGEVLGVDNGRGSYRTDLHENYSRLFAAHNTVIVNGASRGEGGWVNLGINPVELVAMEPRPMGKALSPHYSFSTTSFVDDKGEGAEAYQERTLALVRTSPTTGYYVDVFRSRSDLPDEFHDYVYHNLGDGLYFRNDDLELRPDPERYRANADAEWIQNRKYRNPGWQFFDSVQTSKSYNKAVRAQFVLDKLDKPGDPKIFMGLHIPGFDGREYTKVMAPGTFGAPSPYDQKPTPTLLIRNKGEAWKRPFVVVFEPYSGTPDDRSVRSVEKLESDGIYQGLKITSETEKGTLVQYVLTSEGKNTFSDKEMDISFTGKFAVVTWDGMSQPDGTRRLKDIYIGEGRRLRVGNVEVTMPRYATSAYVDFTKEKIIINGNASVNTSK